jgi:tetratricopeptide (TPR) repeat protein
MSFLASLLLLGQVGPAPALHLPTGLEDRQRPAAAAAAPAAVPQRSRTALEECMSAARSDPPGAVDIAEAWLGQAKGTDIAPAQFCLGSAQAALGRFDEAETAFVAGRDAAAGSNTRLRAQLGAMAGTMALTQGEAARALAALDKAHADALAAPDAQLGGDIAVDRSRALVALKREDDAAKALAEARTASPQNADAWLLSATLSRRQNKLTEAQAQIETAAQLDPVDPAIGLEAGVIAVLSGRDEAARRSWQSVITAAPDSDAAKTATGYLAQLDSGAKPGAVAPSAAAATPKAEGRK